VLQATTNERELEIHNELDSLLKQTNKKALVTKNMLKHFNEDISRLKTPSGKATQYQAAELRIREHQTTPLTRKFVDIMKHYQEVQLQFKNDVKNKIKRQIQLVKPDATAEEIDAVFKKGGGSGEILKTTILRVSWWHCAL